MGGCAYPSTKIAVIFFYLIKNYLIEVQIALGDPMSELGDELELEFWQMRVGRMEVKNFFSRADARDQQLHIKPPKNFFRARPNINYISNLQKIFFARWRARTTTTINISKKILARARARDLSNQDLSKLQPRSGWGDGPLW